MSSLMQLLEDVMNGSPAPASNVQPEMQSGDGPVPTPEAAGEDTDAGVDDPSFEARRMRLNFAESCMDHHGLEGPARDDVRRFARLDPAYRDLELFIVLTEVLRAQSGSSTAAHDFVRSNTFRTHVSNRLKMVILAPHTMFYVTPLQEWVLEDMQARPEEWKIPQEIIDNNDQWEIFAQLVRVRLTTLRSQMKDRLFKAVQKGQDINQILFKLAPRQAIISDAHRARWAWIVLCIDDFNEACQEGTQEKTQFWDFLEQELSATKKAIEENPRFLSPMTQLDKFAEIFVRALDEHRRRFPTRVKRGRTGERAAWQATVEEAMGMGRVIYAMTADDD